MGKTICKTLNREKIRKKVKNATYKCERCNRVAKKNISASLRNFD